MHYTEKQQFLTAVTFATNAHHTQRRKASNDPYIVHPMRVAYLAIDAQLPIEAICAAVLHDVVEDCEVPIAEVENLFGKEIANVVLRLSKWWPDGAEKSQVEKYKKVYYQKIAEDQNAVNVKLLDRIDNLRDMMLLLPSRTRWAVNYLRKTKNEVDPLVSLSDKPEIRELYKGTIKLYEAKLLHYGIEF